MEDRLQKLVAIVDAGSFTKAAIQLRVSQPALTVAINKLESELKTVVLKRSRNGVTLTNDGKEVYQAGLAIRSTVRNLKTAVRTPVPLRFGCIDSVIENMLDDGKRLDAVKMRTNLEITVDNTSTLIELLRKDMLDIAVTVKPSVIPKFLNCSIIGNEPLVLVSHKNYVMTKKLALISYNQKSNTGSIVKETLEKLNIDYSIVLSSTSPIVMLQLVRAKYGVAVLPLSMVYEELLSGDLIIAKEVSIQRSVCLMTTKGSALSEGAQLIHRNVNEQLRDLNLKYCNL